VRDVEVIDDPSAAVAALEPVRARLLSELAQPGSASTLAGRVGLTRQRVNYHLRTLEAHGLVSLVREQRRRGLTERVMQASAAAYVVSPAALGQAAIAPERADRLSASYLVALAARAVREVGDLVRRAERAGNRLATLSLDTQVSFRSAADRAQFTRELTDAVSRLVAQYHVDADAPGGRAYRLIVMAHPVSAATQQEDA
jgi:DNA-binding transcriptional ArsR family regulator